MGWSAAGSGSNVSDGPVKRLDRKVAGRFERHNPPVASFVSAKPLMGSQPTPLPNCYREGNGSITSGSRDFETREIFVQKGPGRP
jgi:hypothetical protein